MDHSPTFLPSTDDDRAGDEGFPVPPQVLARWAAMASERACLSTLPAQLR